jgi:hypothetical protein
VCSSPPETPLPLLERFPDGLTTAEVAALLADGPDPIADLEGTEQALLELVADGHVTRVPLGQDALWRSAQPAAELPESAAPGRSVAVT